MLKLMLFALAIACVGVVIVYAMTNGRMFNRKIAIAAGSGFVIFMLGALGLANGDNVRLDRQIAAKHLHSDEFYAATAGLQHLHWLDGSLVSYTDTWHHRSRCIARVEETGYFYFVFFQGAQCSLPAPQPLKP